MTQVTKEQFGTIPQKGSVEKFILKSDDVVVEIISLGCIITALKTKDKRGQFDDIVLGFDNLEGYCFGNSRYFGAVVGRVANRIAKGKFSVDGKEYQLGINNGPNALHGGLEGFDKAAPDIYDHEVSIPAEAYLPVDDTMIPTGEVRPVQGSPFDLRSPVLIGQRLKDVPGPGFDHNFCVSSPGEPLAERPCARVYHPGSGRGLAVSTTMPGMQFYTANFLDGSVKGKAGVAYPKHGAFCLETQNWPNAVNQAHFPDALLRPGEKYHHKTSFRFFTA
ncbi:galactose mutarotase isoform X3 [Amia ocellicauda]|uniref:galactose mutarotase isoform X3 n=1 Tax=Amia ocellicauda TaxID=2972642 RepID=UPI003463F8E3